MQPTDNCCYGERNNIMFEVWMRLLRFKQGDVRLTEICLFVRGITLNIWV